MDGHPVAKDHLAYLPAGRTSLTLAAGVEPLRVLLIGGEPLGEQIVMWWNFVGRSHEEIVDVPGAVAGGNRRRGRARCRRDGHRGPAVRHFPRG